VFRILRHYRWKAHEFSFFTTFPENYSIGEQMCVEVIQTLIEHCHLTSLEIFFEGLLVCLFPLLWNPSFTDDVRSSFDSGYPSGAMHAHLQSAVDRNLSISQLHLRIGHFEIKCDRRSGLLTKGARS
jgi:hypothetical protein